MGSAAPLHQSFINVGRFRHAYYAAAATLASIVVYLADTAHRPARGDTWVGYALGTLAAAEVLLLMGYGIRRRAFRSRSGGTSSWLSIHVYLGLGTPVVAALHCGFDFGPNIHTLAYVLLCLVVASGAWGAYVYVTYPPRMVRQRGGLSREALVERLAQLDDEAGALSRRIGGEVRHLVADAIERTRAGGTLWSQLLGRDQSMLLLPPVGHHGYTKMIPNPRQQPLIGQLALHQSQSQSGEDQEALHRLLELCGEKAVLLRRLQRDIQMQGLLQFWMYLHLPLSFGLIVCLVAHVIAVFFYR